MQKPLIVYCDDQQRFLDQFVEKHSSVYDIVTVLGVEDLIPTLERLNRKPDLILLDLFFPQDGPDFAENRQRAEAVLAALDAQIEGTREAVFAAWNPDGVEALRRVRQKYTPAEVPVIMYSQKGLFLLDDSRIQAIEQYEAEWLLKKQFGPEVERARINRIMRHQAPPATEPEAYPWGMALLWLVIGWLLAFWWQRQA